MLDAFGLAGAAAQMALPPPCFLAFQAPDGEPLSLGSNQVLVNSRTLSRLGCSSFGAVQVLSRDDYRDGQRYVTVNTDVDFTEPYYNVQLDN
jgi:hypothetical protein